MENNDKYNLSFFGSKELSPHLLQRRNVVRMIIFTTIYSLVFINIFRPFNSEDWIPDGNSTDYFLYSSLMVIVGMVVISLSRVVMNYFVKKIRIGFMEYVVWLVLEAFLLAAFYVFIAYKVGFVTNYLENSPETSFGEALFEIYIRAAVNTIWMLLIPYTIALLYLGNEDLRKKVVENNERPAWKIIQLKDERGKICFSTAVENVLYIEASDNYVNVKYVNNDGVSVFVLRNKLKNIEEDLLDTPLRRCHRSYMINLLHVRSIKHDQNELELEFDTTSIKNVAITKKYNDSIIEAFMKYSGNKD